MRVKSTEGTGNHQPMPRDFPQSCSIPAPPVIIPGLYLHHQRERGLLPGDTPGLNAAHVHHHISAAFFFSPVWLAVGFSPASALDIHRMHSTDH